MGIIARQTIKGSIYSYLGAFIGFINVGLIMPQIFTTAEIGLTNLLIALATIFGQFGSLGLMNVSIKLFPYFRDDKNKHNGFLFFITAVGTLGFIICAIVYYANKNWLIETNLEKSPLFAQYVFLLLPLVFITIFNLLIDTYNRMLFNASFGLFVKEFLLRLINFVGIGLFWFNIFDFHNFIIFYTLAYGMPVILICLLLIYKKQFCIRPSFKIFKPKFIKEIISVAAFGLISGFSGIVVMQIDRYLINHYCDLSATGIYSTVFFFGSVILLPGRSLIRISSSLIAEALKIDDTAKIISIYKKSTTNLLITGTLLFLLVWGNIDNILSVLPAEFEMGRYVILFISLAHLMQMIAGVSGEIIQFSKYYRQHTVIMIVLIISILLLNIVLIPLYGITGAGLASAISFFIYSLIRFIYVKIKFGFQPFMIKHLLILIIGILVLFIVNFIPQLQNVILDTVIRSSLLLVLFVIPIFLAKFSDEFNESFHKLLNKIK